MRFSTGKKLQFAVGLVAGAAGIVAVLGFAGGSGSQHTVERSPQVEPGEGMTAEDLEEAARTGAPREYGGPAHVDDEGRVKDR